MRQTHKQFFSAHTRCRMLFVQMLSYIWHNWIRLFDDISGPNFFLGEGVKAIPRTACCCQKLKMKNEKIIFLNFQLYLESLFKDNVFLTFLTGFLKIPYFNTFIKKVEAHLSLNYVFGIAYF